MKNIKYYQLYFKTGLWHVHTNYTDGKHSIEELCNYAEQKGKTLICFTEHIQQKPTYDYNQFLKDILIAKKKHPKIKILSGVEAKILPNGNIDCPEEIMKKTDVVYLAEHGFKGNYGEYVEALKKGLQNRYVQVWAHPFLLPKKKGWQVKKKDYQEIIAIIKRRKLLIEKNKKYGIINKKIYQDIPEKQVINGEDLHEIKKTRVVMLLSNGFEPDPRVYKEAKTLVKSGYDITIFCLDRNENLPTKEILNSIKIQRFRVGKVKPGNIFSVGKALIKFYRRAIKEISKNKPAIIHAHDFDTAILGLRLKKKTGAKLIIDEHDIYYTQIPNKNIFFKILKKIIQNMEIKIVKKADHVITVTKRIGGIEEGVKEYFIKKGVPTKKIIVIWNYPLRLRKYPRTRTRKTRVSFIGTVRDEKTFKDILEIIKEKKDIELHIYGRGKVLEQLKKRKEKNIKLHKPIPYQEIGRAYAKTDMVISIYDEKRENIKRGIGTKIFEAAYFGVPVITNKNTLSGEFVVKNNLGFAVESKEEIKKAIEQIKKKKNRITKNEAWIWKKQEQNLIKVYEQLIKG